MHAHETIATADDDAGGDAAATPCARTYGGGKTQRTNKRNRDADRDVRGGGGGGSHVPVLPRQTTNIRETLLADPNRFADVAPQSTTSATELRARAHETSAAAG